MQSSNNHRQKREFRQRVDALHRAYHRRPQPTIYSLADDFPTLGDASPFTLTQEIELAAKKRGRNHPTFLSYAKMLAASFGNQEPNPKVRAMWAVEQALLELSRGLSFDHAVPDLFINGTGYDSHGHVNTLKGQSDWAGLHNKDLETIGYLNPTVHEDVITASWYPTHPCRIYDSDPIRPPVESLSLIRQQITGEFSDSGIQNIASGSMICIGLGYAVAAQALSVLLPHHHIHHIPIPYFTPIYDLDRLSKERWDWVIIGIPCFHSWQVAGLLGGHVKPNLSFIKQRDFLKGKYADKKSSRHVGDILKIADKFLKRGENVAVIGSPEPYQAAKSSLQSMLIPHPDSMTAKSIWVDYEKRPWTPHNLPSPTGRLVSFWKVK